MAARMRSVCSNAELLRIRKPKPSDEEMNSATMTPITERVTPILRPENRYGIEAGSRTSQKVRQVEAVRLVARRTSDRSVASRPAIIEMKIGKKAMKVAMVRRAGVPMPAQTMN